MPYAVVHVPIAPIRKEASHLSPLEDEAVYGMKVFLLHQTEDWFLIRTHYRYEGYMHAGCLLPDPEKTAKWDSRRKKMITKRFADMMAEPRYQSRILLTIPKSSCIAVEGEAEGAGYAKAVLADGTRGFIRKDFLGDGSLAGYEDGLLGSTGTVRRHIACCLGRTEHAFRRSLVEEALSYIGTQYRWGGRTPMGIDCSGFCFTVYLMNGLIIYRNSTMQEGFPVKEIAYEKKKPGDLLYFPGHIAMYIGRQKYIHATGREGGSGVVINSLREGDADYRADLHHKLYAAGSVFYENS